MILNQPSLTDLPVWRTNGRIGRRTDGRAIAHGAIAYAYVVAR